MSYDFLKPDTDYSRSAKQLILDEINLENAIGLRTSNKLTVEQISFDIPVAQSGMYNTRLKLSAYKRDPLSIYYVDPKLLGYKYKGSITVNYNRINIDTINIDRTIPFIINTELLISDLVPTINFKFNLNLDTSDYINSNLPHFNGILKDIVPLSIPLHTSSLLFIGALNISIQKAGILLSTILSNRYLSGLKYTPPGIVCQIL